MVLSIRINKASSLIKRDFFRTERSCELEKKGGNSVIIVTKPKIEADLDKIMAKTFKKDTFFVKRLKSPMKRISL